MMVEFDESVYNRRRTDMENRIDKLELHFEKTLSKVEGMHFAVKMFSVVIMTGLSLFSGSIVWYANQRNGVIDTLTVSVNKLSTIVEVMNLKQEVTDSRINRIENKGETK